MSQKNQNLTMSPKKWKFDYVPKKQKFGLCPKKVKFDYIPDKWKIRLQVDFKCSPSPGKLQE